MAGRIKFSDIKMFVAVRWVHCKRRRCVPLQWLAARMVLFLLGQDLDDFVKNARARVFTKKPPALKGQGLYLVSAAHRRPLLPVQLQIQTKPMGVGSQHEPTP